ncbi:hypothetical protein [Cryobacterium sp. M23]|nr:hypothetical protein [Cryobacterium sp. M23]
MSRLAFGKTKNVATNHSVTRVMMTTNGDRNIGAHDEVRTDAPL